MIALLRSDGVRDHRPLQQGLRLIPRVHRSCLREVRDHRPLQQGLRRFLFLSIRYFFYVRDHRPLQQGLRLKCDCTSCGINISTRPSSTTTRIKTLLHCKQTSFLRGTRPSSTATRIKTHNVSIHHHKYHMYETFFHYNKD